MIFFFKNYPLLWIIHTIRYGCEHTIFYNIIPGLKFKFSYLATMEISPSHSISLSFSFPTSKKRTIISTSQRQVCTKCLLSAVSVWVREQKALKYSDYPGVGHGNPLQYSSLENPMDRGAWQVTVHGVVKSRTQLSN